MLKIIPVVFRFVVVILVSSYRVYTFQRRKAMAIVTNESIKHFK